MEELESAIKRLEVLAISLTTPLPNRQEVINQCVYASAQIQHFTRLIISAHNKRKQDIAHLKQLGNDRLLLLQNLNYEKIHLKKEIETCQGMETLYQTVELMNENDMDISTQVIDTNTDSHLRMLLKLQKELLRRQTLEQQLQTLQQQKLALQKSVEEVLHSGKKMDEWIESLLQASVPIQSSFGINTTFVRLLNQKANALPLVIKRIYSEMVKIVDERIVVDVIDDALFVKLVDGSKTLFSVKFFGEKRVAIKAVFDKNSSFLRYLGEEFLFSRLYNDETGIFDVGYVYQWINMIGIELTGSQVVMKILERWQAVKQSDMFIDKLVKESAEGKNKIRDFKTSQGEDGVTFTCTVNGKLSLSGIIPLGYPELACSFEPSISSSDSCTDFEQQFTILLKQVQ